MWCWVSSFFRFGSAGVGCSWSKMLGVECLVFARRGLPITELGLGSCLAGSWTVGYWLVTRFHRPVGYRS